MKKILLVSIILCGCAGDKSGPTPAPNPNPSSDRFVEQRKVLAETGGDLQLLFTQISAFQANQIFAPITGEYKGLLRDTQALRRYEAGREIMIDGLRMEYWHNSTKASIAGTYTGETYATYTVDVKDTKEVKSMVDYGIARLTVADPLNTKLDIKLAVNGEFNNIVMNKFYFYYHKDNYVNVIEGSYDIPFAAAIQEAGIKGNPALSGWFVVKR